MGQKVASGVKIIPMGVTHDEAYSQTRDWCAWDRMYGREYLVPYYVLFSKERVAQIAEVTEKAYELFDKTMKFIQQQVPDDYLIHQLGVPDSILDAARVYVPFTGITRFDFAIYEDQLSILEYNADTPTGVVETAYVAESVIQRFSSYENPSADMNDLIKKAIEQMIGYYQKQGYTGEIVFSAAGQNEEDLGTVMYAQHQINITNNYVNLEDLRLEHDGLYANGKKVSIWYRLYPWEHLPFDEDETGFPTGEHVLQSILNGQLQTISAPQEIIRQSKGLQAFIWEMSELGHPLLDPEDLLFIKKHMLRSSFEAQSFQKANMAYVSKPFFGREGGAVTLFDQQGSIEERDGEAHYWDQPMLYQERVELPSVQIDTEEGRMNGYLLLGGFCIDGKFAGILPRIGGKITGNLSYFAPAAME